MFANDGGPEPVAAKFAHSADALATFEQEEVRDAVDAVALTDARVRVDVELEQQERRIREAPEQRGQAAREEVAVGAIRSPHVNDDELVVAVREVCVEFFRNYIQDAGTWNRSSRHVHQSVSYRRALHAGQRRDRCLSGGRQETPFQLFVRAVYDRRVSKLLKYIRLIGHHASMLSARGLRLRLIGAVVAPAMLAGASCADEEEPGGLTGGECRDTTYCWPEADIVDVFEASGATGSAGAGLVFDGNCPVGEPGEPINGSATMLDGRPTNESGQCCYAVHACSFGRPFLVRNEMRVARAVERDDWTDRAGSPPGSRALPREALDALTRQALAEAWLEDALLEHASIAAFARLSLELLAVGAPPGLIAAAGQAGLDELTHAKTCFAMAAAYAERELGPGKLDLHHAVMPVSLGEVAERALVEGCIGETIAALLAAERARVTTDPALRATLASISEDEARHAELSWRIVAWAARVGGEDVLRVVRLALDGARAEQVALSIPPGVTLESWRAHGRLGEREHRDVVRAAWREVIGPTFAALERTATLTRSKPNATSTATT